MIETAITTKNLLPKIYFVKFGHGYLKNKDKLLFLLNSHLKKSDEKYVTRQAIKYWIEKNSSPSRKPAHLFLRDFVEKNIFRDELDDDSQKMVYDQIIGFLNRRLGEKKDGGRSNIRISGHNRIVFDQYVEVEKEIDFVKSMEGIYVLHHIRFTENKKNMFAHEILEVFRKGVNLNFKLHYRDENEEISCHEGVVLQVGRSIWFISYSEANYLRFRVMCFRDAKYILEEQTKFRWGIALSDIPNISESEPAATRITMELVNGRMEDHSKMIGATDFSNLGDRAQKVMKRLLENSIVAESKAGSIEPKNDQTIDKVLKVNRNTAEFAYKLLTRYKNDDETHWEDI